MQALCRVNIVAVGHNRWDWMFTCVDLICDNYEILGEALRIWNVFPIGLKRNAREAEDEAGVGSHKKVQCECRKDHPLLPYFVGRK